MTLKCNTNSKAASLRIIGRVTHPLSVPIEALQAMDCLEVGNLPMICGSGEPKGRIGQCRGVLLAEVINRAEVLVKEHNDTKKMFVVAASDDGYKAVFSWQEIFNSLNGALCRLQGAGTAAAGQHPAGAGKNGCPEKRSCPLSTT